jgi:spermidine/putrescine transport system permease protein
MSALSTGPDEIRPLQPDERRRRRGARGVIAWLRNPWGRPRFLPIVVGVYLIWSIIPVAIAVLFAFNDGRSRTTLQGLSMRWFTGDPTGSVAHDPALQSALKHTLILAVICVAISVPLGVMLALGLQRWRGRGSGTANTLMLLPLVTPEIVMGVSLLLLFLQVFSFISLGTWAQAIGQVTFALSYVVVIVRGRLVSIGRDYEEAAADLGAPPRDRLFRVLLPLLAPAILASAAIVFALSIDDFVITQYLAAGADTNTVSMLLYSTARGAPTPALNALATITLVITLLTIGLAYLVYRRFAGAGSAAAVATLEA